MTRGESKAATDKLLKEVDGFIQSAYETDKSGVMLTFIFRGVIICIKLLVRMNQHIEEEWDD